MYFVTLKCFGFVKNLGVLIFMTLVYNNTTCEQAIFTYAFSGQNLNNDNIVFTVKKLVSNFKRDFPLILRLMEGQKNIIWMNYWVLLFMVFIIIVLVVENWLIG